MNDFISRGSEVSRREQKGLSTYLPWLPHTFGIIILSL